MKALLESKEKVDQQAAKAEKELMAAIDRTLKANAPQKGINGSNNA